MRFLKRMDSIGKAYVYLDLEGLKIPGIVFDPEPLLSFRIETYAVLKANASEFNWEVVFSTTHQFLKTLNEEEKQKFASMIILMHYEIMQKMNTEQDLDGKVMTQLETTLSQLLSQFDQDINLMNRLIEFTDASIPIQSFAGVGERAQDTVEMTFFRDDVVRLTAVVLLCKLMTPIFGIFIESCKKRMDNAYKEIHCVAILKDILANRCRPLTEKLSFFITKIIKPMLNRVKLTHVYNGYTFSVITQQIYAAMLTRRFIAVDLFKPNGNLITYVTSCARAAAQTQFSSTGFKTAVAEIIPPREQASEEDGNVSNLEAESRSSSKTADFNVIIEAAVRQLKDRFVAENDLDREAIEAAEWYYSMNHITLTPCNSYLLGILFDSYLCGAKSVEMLDGKSLNSLIPIMQAYFIQQGYVDLVHAVSVTPTGQLKAFLTGNDTQLKTTWNNSFEYRNCDLKFPYSVNDIRWDTGLKKIVDNLTSEIMLYNTAPSLLEKLQEESKNGEQFVTPDGLSRSICAFISQVVP